MKFIALALIALTATAGASAAAPRQSITCVSGGRTSFAHAPKGTKSVTFVYGALADVVTWVGGRRSFATPTDVKGGIDVVATFYRGGTPLATARTTCS